MRLASALGVVWLHAGVLGSHIGGTGLVMFATFSIFLSGEGKTVAERAQRLLIPWLIWFVLYAALAMLAGNPPIPLSAGMVAGVLDGSAYHLWYLPFIFAVLVALDAIKRTSSRKLQAWLGAICAIALLLTLRKWDPLAQTWASPWGKYMGIAPAVCLGLFLARFDSLNKRAAWAALILIWLAALTAPAADIGLYYKLGVPIAALVLLRPVHVKLDVRAWSRCTLGIYLIHPLLLTPLIAYRPHLGIAMPIIAFAASAMIVRALLNIKWLARYVF